MRIRSRCKRVERKYHSSCFDNGKEKRNAEKLKILYACRYLLLFHSFSSFHFPLSNARSQRSLASKTRWNWIRDLAESLAFIYGKRFALRKSERGKRGEEKKVKKGKKRRKKKGKKRRDVARKIKCQVNAFRAGKSFLATVRIFLSGLHLFMSPTFAPREEYLAQEIKAFATTFLSDLLSRFFTLAVYQ